MRGRKPKPTAIKRLTGNPGRRPLNDAEPQPPIPEGTPYVPRWLNREGKKAWRELVKILLDCGLYTDLDRWALAMFCQVWGRYVEAERMVEEEGEFLVSEAGNRYVNPVAYRADKHFEQVRKMLSEFGLSPAERSRVKVAVREQQLSLADVLFADVELDG